jgi:hypothetical protein
MQIRCTHRAMKLGYGIVGQAFQPDLLQPWHVSASPYPFTLSDQEIGQARRLAERHLAIDASPLSPREQVFFIKVELLPDSQAETSQRLVMVTHYRYRDDETVHSMIDLGQHQVLKVETHQHFPTGLAAEESQRAEELARRDERLQPLLETATPAIRLLPRPLQFSQPDEAFFGHRMVQLLLLQGDVYLPSPHVLVDLTTETIHLTTDP